MHSFLRCMYKFKTKAWTKQNKTVEMYQDLCVRGLILFYSLDVGDNLEEKV